MKRPVLLVALALAACSPSRGQGFDQAMAQAARANGAGRDADAARAFEQAAARAKIARDADFARHEAGLAWLRAGDEARGAALLSEVGKGKGEYAVSARYKLASHRLDNGDATALNELEALMHDAPNSGYARTAFGKLLRHHDERGDADAWLDRQGRELAASDLAQRVAYERAKRVEAAGNAADALARYLQIADRWPYPRGVHFDDALMRAAAIERNAGAPERAIALLRRLLAQRESSHVMGSYEKVAYAEAQLEIARLYEGPLADRSRARAEYHRLFSDFPTATSRDDALWKEAALWQADGDKERACGTLRALVSNFPDSRYVQCAVDRCALSRPKESRAPAQCRAYLTRQ